MNSELIPPFINSTVSVFSTMLGCKIEAGEASDEVRRPPAHDVTGIIGLSGKNSSGVVMVHITKDIALNVAGAMLGGKPSEINADVIDAIGELTNMIAGGAKSQLGHKFENLALPMVLLGKNGSIEFPSRTKPICIPFESPWGSLSVEIDVKETR